MSEMVGRWTRGIEPDNRTIQEQQLIAKLAERDALLRKANGLLGEVDCPMLLCDGNGVCQASEADIWQCQWCAEKEEIRKVIGEIEK